MQKGHCSTNNGLCHFRLYSYILIITAVLGCPVGYLTRKCCDCVIHESRSMDMITQMQLITEAFVKRTILIFAVHPHFREGVVSLDKQRPL